MIILIGNVYHQHQTAGFDVVVGGVVQDVTMQHPLAGFSSDKLYVVPLAW